MKIQRDGNIIECSKNTFETMFKRLGYEIVVEKKEKTIEESVVVEEVKKTKKK